MEGREKRRRQIVDETQSLGIECLGKDVWSLVLKHLSLGYVRALRQTNKHIEEKTREYFFSTYIFYLGRMRNDNIPSMIRGVHTHLISDYKRIEESNLKITYLRLSWLFNCSITIPPNVTHFRTGHSFNHPIVFPSGLINFEMGWCFNQPIELPPNVKDIEMGHDFNQPIVLPPGLTHLTVGMSFDQDINIPSSVIRFHGPWRWKPMIQKHIEATYF
jgi:FNIP Repeat